MKKIKYFFFFVFLMAITYCRANPGDSLTIFNYIDSVELKMSTADYLSEVDVVFKDSLKYEIRQFISDTISAAKRKNAATVFLDGYFFTGIPDYDYHVHPVFFDRVLLNLLKQNKLTITDVKDRAVYQVKDVTIKEIKAYRFQTLYCGKDWGVFYKDKLLTTFTKSTNHNAYRIIDPF